MKLNYRHVGLNQHPEIPAQKEDLQSKTASATLLKDYIGAFYFDEVTN